MTSLIITCIVLFVSVLLIGLSINSRLFTLIMEGMKNEQRTYEN